MTVEISIIIPTLNEQSYLPKLLNSIAEQDYKEKFEVIVVDGKSEDKTLEVANSYKGKIDNLHIIETSRGVAHQRNVGANKAQGKTLIFLDADTLIPKQFVSNVLQRINYKEEFIITPLLLPISGSVIDYLFVCAAYVYFFAVSFSKPITTGMCIITTKKNHDKIGGFNEAAVYGEDIDYGLRAVEKGAKYHLNLTIKLYASTRRKVKISRFKLGLLWLQWYKDIIKHGAITDKSKYEYAFGSHTEKI